MLLTSVLFLVHSFRHQQWQWANTVWFKSVWLFWAFLLIINLPLSIHPTESALYSFTFIRWPIFAAALGYWVLRDKPRQVLFVKALLLTSCFVVLDTVWQYIFDVDWFGIERFSETRLTGPFRGPKPGTLMLRVWFIMAFAVFLLPWLKSQRAQIAYLLILLSSGLGFIFITGERMAFIVFFSGMLVCFLGMFIQYTQYRKLIAFGASIVFLSLTFIAVIDPVMSQRTIWSIFEKLTNFYHSDYGMEFRGAIAAWETNPWLGSGLHTQRMICEDLGVMASFGRNCTHPHNLYLHLGVETGIVGVSLFSVMLLCLYRQVLSPLWAQRHWLALSICFTVMTASFWPFIGGISVLNNWVAALVWLGVGCCLAISLDSQHTQRD